MSLPPPSLHLADHEIEWTYDRGTNLWSGFGTNAVRPTTIPQNGGWALFSWPIRILDVFLQNAELVFLPEGNGGADREIPPVMPFRLVPGNLDQPSVLRGILYALPSYLLINSPTWIGPAPP